MTTAEILSVLNTTEVLSQEQERLLKNHLVQQVERYKQGKEAPEDIAYEMAGLMNARPIWQLPRDNPFIRVLRFAGYLELPEAHREPGDTWEELIRRISDLP